jgi:4-alpha-glucanotransferase
MESLVRNPKGNGVGLYLDLPLGSHPGGYDTYRWRELFALDSSTGAPPDPLAEQGQNWGFPPMRPEMLRKQGFRYHVDCIRHHLRVASALRIDHVMGFHRLYWVPHGMPASQGVYVRYPAEEFYAILSLESHRHKATIVGEDLGTVPPYVRRTMSRHGLHRMYVLPFQVRTKNLTVSRPRPDAVAALNTHDMPPFAAYWQGLDIQKRREMGFLNAKSERQERSQRRLAKSILVRLLRSQHLLSRADDVREVLDASLAWLSDSPSSLVLVNLEDLWQEMGYQNMPGTTNEHPNWCRKSRHSIEEFSKMPQVLDVLRLVDRLRVEGGSQ